MPKSDENIHQNVPNCCNLKKYLRPAQRITPPSKFTQMKQMIAQLNAQSNRITKVIVYKILRIT